MCIRNFMTCWLASISGVRQMSFSLNLQNVQPSFSLTVVTQGFPSGCLGVEIPWSLPVRILGIWFSRSLCFFPHFNTVKVKNLKKINYLKLITSHSRGVSSTHMLFIINSVIRKSLEYGPPLFFDSLPSALQIFEVCYNASIRLVTGLPR